MHLADRSRRERLGFEGLEDFLDRPSELPGDDLTDHVFGQWRRLVLELGQLRLISGRHQVGPCRKDLTELDEGDPQVLEREADTLGPGVRLDPPGVAQHAMMQRDKPVETQDADQETETVPAEGPSDLPVTRRLGRGGQARPSITTAYPSDA